MKSKVQSLVAMALIGGAMMLNSCSSTQDFAGYYPENKITGKGTGHGAGKTDVTATEVKTETVVAEAPVTAGEQTTVATAQTAEVKQPSKFQKRMMNLATKTIANADAKALAANSYGTGKFSWKEKLVQKMFNASAKKQLAQMAELQGAAGISGKMADIFAIVSIASAGAAWLWYAGFFFGPAAIVFGVLALIGGTSRRGMAIAGIIIGAVALLWWTLFIAVIWSPVGFGF
jgi:hypothetical protein